MASKLEKLKHIGLLLEAMPVAVSLYDQNDIIIDCNMEAVELFGFTNKANLIKEFNERYFDFSTEYQPCGTLSREKKEEAFKQVHSKGRFQVEWIHLDVHGKELPINATLTKIEIEDTTLITVCDVDLRETRLDKARKMEAERRLYETEIATIDREKRFKEDLLAMLSHEMRTPLAVMSVYAELVIREILKGKIGESALEALSTISDEAHRLADLATDSMDMFVKKAAADSEASVDIGKMISQLVNMITSTTQKQNVVIVLKLPEYLPLVWGRAAELTRVLWNIFDNALRYTESGTINVAGDLRVIDGSRHIAVTITDTGCGMTKEIKSHVFERGYSSEDRTGLGLAFCKEIIKAHGGVISIESEIGTGCAVTFTLPEYCNKEDSHV